MTPTADSSKAASSKAASLKDWRIAIDFGTSNTALVEQRLGQVRPVRLTNTGALTMPSALVWNEDEPRIGDAAIRQARFAGAQFVAHPKELLGEDVVDLPEGGVEPHRLVAAVLRRVRSVARSHAGASAEPAEVWLTHPADWGPVRIARLRRAAVEAGFDEGSLRTVSEPVAAAHHYAEVGADVAIGENLAVFDFGGGTCDVAVLARTDDTEYEVLAHHGDPELGGRDIDEVVVRWVLERLVADGHREAARHLDSPAGLRDALSLRDAARHLKEELSHASAERIGFTVGSGEYVYQLTRREFDTLIAAEVDRGAALLQRALDDVDDPISALYLTGGSAHIPAIARALKRVAGVIPATLDDPKLVVADGALRAPPPVRVRGDVPDETLQLPVGQRMAEVVVATAETVAEEAGSDHVVEAVRRRMTRVPTVAVVGRVKAGKSTLVNAVIGRDAAPTDARECTQIPARYVYGSPERCEVVLHDGERFRIPLEQGRVPRELPWAPELVEHVIVYLQSDPLRGFTLVDTPGLATTSEAGDATWRYLTEADHERGVDALVYVFRGTPFGDDIEALRSFQRGGGAIGVLSHADAHTPPWGADDPLVAAAEDAMRIDGTRPELTTVLPLAGRLAEVGRAGLIRSEDARRLALLRETSDLDLQFADDPDDAERIAALAELFGEYGLRHGRVEASHGAAALTRWTQEISGIGAVVEALGARAVGRHHVIAASESLDQLEELARFSGQAAAVDAVREARLHPDLHGVTELDAYRMLGASHPEHPALVELGRLLDARSARDGLDAPSGLGDAELRERAVAAARAARANGAVAMDQRVRAAYAAVTKSYTLIAERFTPAD